MKNNSSNDERDSKIIIVDDFYNSPYDVRKLALKSSFANIETTDYPGFASKLTVSNEELKKRFERLLNQKVIVDPSRFTWGGFRFITKDTGSRPNVHADAATDWAAMVYLTPDAPDSAGTGFYKHKQTGFTGPPSDKEARIMGYSDSSEYDDKVICPDKSKLDKWELIDTVTPVFNRLIIFNGASLYHAPLGGYGQTKETARLTHIFFFNTVSNSGDITNKQVATFSSAKLQTDVLQLEDSNQKGISSLVGAVKQIIAPENLGNFQLAPFHHAELSNLSYEELVAKCISEDRLYHSTVGISTAGYSLDNLILVEFSNALKVKNFWPVNGWDVLRKTNQPIDLQMARLEGAKLDGANFHKCNLANANFSGASLVKSDLSETNLSGADFTGANLYSSTLKGSDLSFTNLSRSDLRHSDLRETTCINTAFRGADVWNCYAWGVDLSRAFTDGADFDRSDNIPEAINVNDTVSD